MNPEEGDLVEQGGNEFHEKARVPRVGIRSLMNPYWKARRITCPN